MLCLMGGMENREWLRVKYLGEKKKKRKEWGFLLSYCLIENKEKKKENI